jgi:hypothetical protein
LPFISMPRLFFFFLASLFVRARVLIAFGQGTNI